MILFHAACGAVAAPCGFLYTAAKLKHYPLTRKMPNITKSCVCFLMLLLSALITVTNALHFTEATFSHLADTYLKSLINETYKSNLGFSVKLKDTLASELKELGFELPTMLLVNNLLYFLSHSCSSQALCRCLLLWSSSNLIQLWHGV